MDKDTKNINKASKDRPRIVYQGPEETVCVRIFQTNTKKLVCSKQIWKKIFKWKHDGQCTILGMHTLETKLITP